MRNFRQICTIIFCALFVFLNIDAFRLIVTKKLPDEYIEKTKNDSFLEKEPPKEDIVASVEIPDKYIVVSDLFRKIKQDWQKEKGKNYSNLTEFFPTRLDKKIAKKVLTDVKDIIVLIYKQYFDYISQDVIICKKEIDDDFKREKEVSQKKKQELLIKRLEEFVPKIGKFFHDGEVDIDKYIMQNINELRLDKEFLRRIIINPIKMKIKKNVGGRSKTKIKKFRLQATKPEKSYPNYIDEYAKLLRISSYIACDEFEVVSKELLQQSIFELSSQDLCSLIEKPREDIKFLKSYPVEIFNLSEIRSFHNVRLSSFSPDGLKILVEYRDHRAILYDVNTGNEIKIFDGIQECHFFVDGLKILVRYLGNSNLVLFDTATGDEIKVFDDVSRYRFSPDESKIFIEHFGEAVELYDVDTGNRLLSFNISTAIFSFDNSNVFIIDRNNMAALCDMNSGDIIKRFNNVSTANFSDNSSKIFISYQDEQKVSYNSDTGEKINNISENGMSNSPDVGKEIDVTKDTMPEQDKKEEELFEGYPHPDALIDALIRDFYDINYYGIVDRTFSPNESILLVKYDNGNARLYDSNTGVVIQDFDKVSSSADGSKVLIQYKVAFKVSSVAFSADGSKVLIQYKDATLKLYDINKLKIDLEEFIFIVLALKEKDNLLDNKNCDEKTKNKMISIWRELDAKVREYLIQNRVPDLSEEKTIKMDIVN
ncbi:MAG: hypothetical protein ABIA74_03970 [bacterium]